MIDLPRLADKIDALNVGSRAFYDLSRDEILAVCQAVIESIRVTDLREPATETAPQQNFQSSPPFPTEPTGMDDIPF